MRKAFINGQLFTGKESLANHSLVIESENIIDVVNTGVLNSSTTEKIDLSGQWIIPGLIDLQVNGGGGVMLDDDLSEEAVKSVILEHQRLGTVALLPTLISHTANKVDEFLSTTGKLHSQGLAGLLGAHLEGPYLNPLKKGVHDVSRFQSLSKDQVDNLIAKKNGTLLVTLAPELSKGNLLENLAQAGVVVFAGHTTASFEEAQTALLQGVSGFTHIFNAMPPLLNRDPGIVGAALLDKASFCSVIADGHHLHDAVLKLILLAKDKGKVLLVSDAMASVGAEEKAFSLYGQRVLAENGRLQTEQGVLAGADIALLDAVKYMARLLEGDWQEAVRMASLYPAVCLGITDQYGHLKSGAKASFLVVDDDLTLSQVWIEGQRLV